MNLPSGQRFKQLLIINDYPPAGVAGVAIFTRQLFMEYDPERLDVLYCGSWAKGHYGLLPCRHTVVPSYTTNLRPRRIFIPIEATLNGTRLKKIMDMGRRIARERRVEAIFTTSYGAEMPHAAYFLSKELGLPFYYFEMDRLDAVFLSPSAKKLILENRRAFLKHATKLWVISPAMEREFKRLYDVDGEPLHHFVDVETYRRAAAEVEKGPSDKIRVIYTGSILLLLYDAMEWFCRQLHQGLRIGGKTVELEIYSQNCPPKLLGPNVHYRGFVKPEEIPKKLAAADIALCLSGFDVPPGVRMQVETSVSTKTVDYLAAGKPVLTIAPPHSGQVDYYGSVCCVVDRLEPELLRSALSRLVEDPAYVADLRERGFEFIQRRHTLEVMRERFLSQFLTPAQPVAADAPVPADRI